MKKMQKRLALLTLVAALCLGFTFPSHSMARPAGDNQKIELSAEQKETAKRMMSESREAGAGIRQALEAREAALDAQMRSDNPDRNQIETLSREIGELRGKLMLNRLDTRAKMENAGIPVRDFHKKADMQAKKRPDRKDGRLEQNLTPEQQATAKKIIDQSRAATAGTRQELKAKKAELDAIMASATPDKAKIESLSAEVGELRGKLLAAKIDTRAELQKEGIPTSGFNKPMHKGKKEHKEYRGQKDDRSRNDGAVDVNIR